MKKIFNIVGILAIGLALSAGAVEEVEFSLTINSGDGVTVDGEGVNAGDAITEDNIADLEFGEGSLLIVTNNKSGVKYRLSSEADLAFLGNALATNTNGVAIGRWVVGGGVQSNERSTLAALQQSDNKGGASETPGATAKVPVNQPVSQPAAVPNVRPASTPAAPAATPAGP